MQEMLVGENTKMTGNFCSPAVTCSLDMLIDTYAPLKVQVEI